jgi:outer membrane protein OmpA-like peptidoglycan-associated protein
MKTKLNLIKGLRGACSHYSLPIKSTIVGILILLGVHTGLLAQLGSTTTTTSTTTAPSWWFGVSAGANFNFYHGSTREMNSIFTSPATFHDGYGAGLYIGPILEYHRPNSLLGVIFQAGYDSRRGSFDGIDTPCNCPADLTTKISYITIEPSLRLTPFKSNFYLYAGPSMAFNVKKTFTYKQGINPDYPGQVAPNDVKGDLSHIDKILYGMQVGVGYDILLTASNKPTQLVFSPFVSFHPYYGRDPRSIETWNVTTLRVGAAIKIGSGHRNDQKVEYTPDKLTIPEVRFFVNSPENIPTERRVRETFPLRNYIFFEIGSSEIPSRYVLLNKSQVKEFREDQLEVFAPKKLSARSAREMTVYYNILNIVGDRMIKNPSSTIMLSGASMEGRDEGLRMAESVKRYLVDVFEINPSRISTEGRIKPRIPSEQPGGQRDLEMLREGDHRVSITSDSPALLMEFQTGPEAPLRPVEINIVQEAPTESYVTFNAVGSTEAYSSWSMEIRDEAGMVKNYGPYTQERVSIPGKNIMGTNPRGTYYVTMIGQSKNGRIEKKEATTRMVLWTPAETEEGMRYNIIFEFNESKAIAIYEKYLTEVVAPKIPTGGKVIIQGHTDIVGGEAHNLTLSMDRATEVKSIIQRALSNVGRSDVKFEVYGFGEDTILAPFENNLPEERFYNRTVIIDIIPKK